MKNLLVAIDFSDASDVVVEQARELARELPARIVLLHVDEPKAAYVAFGDTANILVSAWPLKSSKRIARLEERLASLADPLKASGIEVAAEVRVGLVVHEILEQAGKYHADYIILGSHGRFAANHLFTGNVFTGIFKRPPCPIIVVPVKADELQKADFALSLNASGKAS